MNEEGGRRGADIFSEPSSPFQAAVPVQAYIDTSFTREYSPLLTALLLRVVDT